MPKHEQFEEMCALAALGELSQEARDELKRHLHECNSCRASMEQFSAVLNELPAVADESALPRPKLLRQDEGYRERFLERARNEGIAFSAQVDEHVEEHRSTWSWPRLHVSWPALTAAAMAVAVLSVAFQIHSAMHRNHDENGGRIAAALSSTQRVEPTLTAGSDASADVEKLRFELGRASAENAALQQRLLKFEQQQQSSATKVVELEAELQQAAAANAKLAQELSERQLKMASLQGEVDSLESERVQVNASLAQQQAQVKSLSQQLQSDRDALTRREQLLAQGRDVRELMGARNLHIIDLYDADGRGRNQNTFGRVFYTEGKSLIFYAFDLDEAKLANAGFSYQAWGAREGQQNSVKRLGMLYVDDHAQKRWVLKVEDPEQLAEIDSVFVTLERSGEAKIPHGQKLLYAYLGSSANHP